MNALWITLAMLVAGFVGWPVTAGCSASPAPLMTGPTPEATPDTGRRRGRGDPGEYPAVPSSGDPRRLQARRATRQRRTPATPPAAPHDAAVSSVRILRGGAIIGILERFAVCLAILAGQPVAIAYVVAIKGLGRFAELKATPVAAERFIIGTLTSMLWAAGVAALAKVLFLG